MGSEEKQNAASVEPSAESDRFTPEYNAIAKLSWENFKTFEWKDRDVTVVTLPRSGTHLAWMIARMLVQGSADPIVDPMEGSHVWLPSFKDTQTGTRVLNTHFHPGEVEDRVLKDGNRKFIYVARNCKDVSVSQFTFFKKFRVFSEKTLPHVWEDYVPTFYNYLSASSEEKPEEKETSKTQASEIPASEDTPSENTTSAATAPESKPLVRSCWWVFHVRAWEDYAEANPDAPILFMYFEDIVRKPEESIRKMAEFLSVPLADDLLQGILAACKFDNMKNAPVTEALAELWAKGTDKTFYRKGAIGDWKNWYTVAQNQFADEFLAKQMAGSRINPISE